MCFYSEREVGLGRSDLSGFTYEEESFHLFVKSLNWVVLLCDEVPQLEHALVKDLPLFTVKMCDGKEGGSRVTVREKSMKSMTRL